MGSLLNRHIRVTPQTSVYSCRWTKTSQSVYTNTHTATHSLVFIRQCWHSALRRRHSSRAQRRAGSADERQKETKKNSQNKKKRSAADGGTTENSRLLRNKCEKKEYLGSDPRHAGRGGAGYCSWLLQGPPVCLSVRPSACLERCLCVCLASAPLCVSDVSFFISLYAPVTFLFSLHLSLPPTFLLRLCESLCVCLFVSLTMLLCFCLSHCLMCLSLHMSVRLLSSCTDAVSHPPFLQTNVHILYLAVEKKDAVKFDG